MSDAPFEFLPILPLPTGPPFALVPGCTYNGGQVPDKDVYLFSFLDDANAYLRQYLTAIDKAGLTIIDPIVVTDGIANGSYSQFVSGDHRVSIYLITGKVQDSDLKVMPLNDVVGNVLARSYLADMAQGDSNYIQIGHPATANQTVPGVLVLAYQDATGNIAAHWEKK